MTITIEDDIELPTKLEVCPDCQGRGHYPPGSYTGDEFEEAFPFPEDKQDYMNGVYDQPCPTCKGKRVVEVVDRKFIPPHHLKLYDEYQRDMAELDACEAAERRMGA